MFGGIWAIRLALSAKLFFPSVYMFCFGFFFATFLLILEPIDYFQKSKEELEEVGVYGLG